MIDVHIHGGFGVDLMRADAKMIKELSAELKKTGVTAWTPTFEAAPLDILKDRAKQAVLAACDDKAIIGLHFEGPFISREKSGVLPSENIIPCDKKYFDELSAYGLPLRFTVAPEAENAISFIEYVTCKGGAVTLGHSNDDGRKTYEAIKAGASGFTHLFNAMRGIHHRQGSIVQTALLSGLPCEIIADKCHLSPDTLQMVYKMLGLENIVLVTDAMSAMQSTQGEYDFCGKNVYYNGKTVEYHGILAGSCLTMHLAAENFAGVTGCDKNDLITASDKNALRLIRQL